MDVFQNPKWTSKDVETKKHLEIMTTISSNTDVSKWLVRRKDNPWTVITFVRSYRSGPLINLSSRGDARLCMAAPSTGCHDELRQPGEEVPDMTSPDFPEYGSRRCQKLGSFMGRVSGF